MCERKAVVSFLSVLFFTTLIAFPTTIFSEETHRPDPYSINKEGDALLHVSGYFQTCVDDPKIFVNTNGRWNKVEDDLPGKGNYYLDGVYIGYGMCDVVACVSITDPLIVRLVERKKVGEQAPPDGDFAGPQPVPMYQTYPLSGPVRIDVTYYDDQECRNKHSTSIDVRSRE